jgi:hypothetical protein
MGSNLCCSRESYMCFSSSFCNYIYVRITSLFSVHRCNPAQVMRIYGECFPLHSSSHFIINIPFDLGNCLAKEKSSNWEQKSQESFLLYYSWSTSFCIRGCWHHQMHCVIATKVVVCSIWLFFKGNLVIFY